MYVQMTFQVGILALAAAINALVTSMAWHRRGSTLARQYFSWMMAAATFYAAVAAMEAGSIGLANKIFWSTLEYVGTGGIIIFFVLFTEAYVHGRSRFARRRLIWLSLWPLINIALVATNTWHRWVWADVVLAAPPSNSAIYSHGPGYAFVLACLYLYSLWGIHLLGRASLSGGPLHQRQARWLLAGALFPYLGGTLYSLKLTPADLNLTPMSFMATGLLCFWGLFRMGVFEAIPIARETLIEHLRDGVIVVNLEHQLIDINPQGRSLTRLKGSAVGRSIHIALSNIPEFLHHYDQGTETPFCLWTDPHNTCHITVQSSALRDYRGKTHGRLLVLHDTTQQYLSELKLRQANTRLSLQLQEIEGLQVKLKTQASRDHLTGLFNRHHLHETLPKVLLQARQNAYSVAFIMLDIDYFKRVNDTFGHQAGDLLIQAFSQILLVQIQEGETAYRLGGEEFLLILPRATLESGIQRANHIRQEFNVSALPWNGTDIRTTVSGGVATFPNHAIQADDLLHAVDLALYAAKKSGRNQITCFNPRIHQPSSV